MTGLSRDQFILVRILVPIHSARRRVSTTYFLPRKRYKYSFLVRKTCFLELTSTGAQSSSPQRNLATLVPVPLVLVSILVSRALVRGLVLSTAQGKRSSRARPQPTERISELALSFALPRILTLALARSSKASLVGSRVGSGPVGPAAGYPLHLIPMKKQYLAA